MRLIDGGGDIPVPLEVFEDLVELEDAGVNMFRRGKVAEAAASRGMHGTALWVAHPEHQLRYARGIARGFRPEPRA